LKKTTIVVVGGGTGGALACGLLATGPGAKTRNIKSVRSLDIPIIGVGESSTPPFVMALNRMGIAKEFVESNACWPKYGVVFDGWADTPLIGGWPANGRRNEMITYLEGLTKGKTIARVGEQVLKGQMPYDKDTDNFYTNIAMHIDSTDTSEWIFDRFKDNIETIYGNVDEVIKGPKGIRPGKWLGVGIDHLIVDGEIVEGDYFLDCTGFSRRLIGELTTDFINSDIPTNSAVFGEIEKSDNVLNPMMTTAKTASAGWMWNIPLKDRFGSGYVYSEEFQTEEEAEIEFILATGVDTASHIHYTPGWLKTPAVGNCFAIGLAAGFLDALDSPTIGLTATMIWTFMKQKEEPSIYNKYCVDTFTALEVYLLMHYRTCTRTDPFWLSFWHYTPKDLLKKFKDICSSDDWDERNISGTISSLSTRIISHRVKIDSDYATLIYNNIPEEDRKKAKELWNNIEGKYVPFDHELFVRHVTDDAHMGSKIAKDNIQ
jgi:tryptophan halogenase